MAKNPCCLNFLGLAAALCILSIPNASRAQFTFVTNSDDTITITGYNGTGGNVIVPDSINGLPVSALGTRAFDACTNVTSVALGTNITSIGSEAFYGCSGLVSISFPADVTNYSLEAVIGCTNLLAVYFQGHPPVDHWPAAPGVFVNDFGATLYYLQGTRGWHSSLDGLPTALWLPHVQTSCVQTNQFGFNINWAGGQTVVVEACTNLVNPAWTPIATNTLTGSSSWFSDPQWTNYPGRFYRLISL